MTQSARESIYEAISSIRLIDPHTHINPYSPASTTLADILGYHYYTELIHSAGMPREEIEEEGLQPRELVRRLLYGLPNIENTANYQWLISICRKFFDFDDTRIEISNWEALYDAAEARMSSAEWPQMVLDQSNVEAVFLTNDFDDDLQGFDTNTYIPCLRTDDLVFHLATPDTRQRLEQCTGIELDGSLQSLRDSLDQRFRHFVSAGARACAISIPPSFEPLPISDGRAATALDEVLRRGKEADESHQVALSRRVFWTLAELCDQYGLPFDLMIGVNRGVYPSGVYQGQDLYDSRVSLIQYRELFNTFRDVKFPVSVLASVTNQELVSYSWIFPNLITNGHWWYSNTPSFIARDAAARLEAVPRNNQIGYYSDAYKLEFVWPKFDMYRQILAGILADHFVGFCGWSEEQAIELGRQVLRDNVDETFPPPQDPEATTEMHETYVDDAVPIDSAPFVTEDSAGQGQTPSAVVAGSAALAAGAIGIVEIQDAEQGDADAEQVDVENIDDEEDAEVDYEQEEIPADLEATVEEVSDVEFDIEDEDADMEYTEDESPTVSQDTIEEVSESDFGDYNTVEEQGLPDLPTVIELQDTVRSDEDEDEDADAEDFEADVEMYEPDVSPTAETVVIDTLPSEDEIEAVDVPDVELRQPPADSAPNAAEIEAEAESDSWFVGDVLGDEDKEDVSDDQAASAEAEAEEGAEAEAEQGAEAEAEEGADGDGEVEAESDSWFVGDVLGDEDNEDVLDDQAASDEAETEEGAEAEAEEGAEAAEGSEEIRMLRGDGSFTPGEESMQLTRDPVTGELMFVIDQSDESAEVMFTDADESAEISDEEADQSANIDYIEDEYDEQDVEALDEDVEVITDLEETVDQNEDGETRE